MSGAERRDARRRDEHQEWDELAVGWAMHALEPEDETAFTAHLAGCARCRGTVSDTTEVMAALASDLPPAEPSDELRERLRAAVAATEQVHRPEPASTGVPAVIALPAPVDLRVRRTGWRRAPQLLVAAGVAAVLGLGAWTVALTQDRDAARATAASQASMISALLAPGQMSVARMESDGTTVATVVAHDGQAQVVTEGMTTNDTADSTYVLWGLTDDGPVAIGTFDVVTDATDLRTVGSDATGLDDYSAYAISLEPGRQAPSEPTDVVARGQVTS
ncbi:anti-sigma factor domain-containing protein [Klenkia sp. PcliD-1-E]|uniref:anti-sigma factor n=1 Tax=Klenkia sp. PcliD-1-E TaxID=2954492 RepID=UPI0020982B14|nr:anti-sigma factor [Klenkia sp. PcliD-1-E]MCO7218699.1 anti-sigma factor [Klenkia sp. PcliD-1-E]